MPNRPVARSTSRRSRTSIVTDALCGSTPIITASTPPLLHVIATGLARAGTACFELGRPLSSHTPPAAPDETALQRRATPKGGQPQGERPAGHLDPSLARPEPYRK